MNVRFSQTWLLDQRRTPATLSGYHSQAARTDIRPDRRQCTRRPHNSHRWPASNLRSAPPDRPCTTTSLHTKNHVSIFWLWHNIISSHKTGRVADSGRNRVLSRYRGRNDIVWDISVENDVRGFVPTGNACAFAGFVMMRTKPHFVVRVRDKTFRNIFLSRKII